jgi:hypothetical protein
MTFPDSRHAAVQNELATFTQHARTLRANDNAHGLRVRVHELLNAAHLLARPLPPVLPDAEIRRVFGPASVRRLGVGHDRASISTHGAR